MLRVLLLFLFTSCAIQHHVQVGDIHRPIGAKFKPFDIKVSATGINVEETGDIISGVAKDNDRARKIAEIIAMFQMGPTTGNPVFNERYADVIPSKILEKCPSGKVTGLLMIRETAKYPVVSGEIVRITGLCQVATVGKLIGIDKKRRKRK